MSNRGHFLSALAAASLLAAGVAAPAMAGAPDLNELAASARVVVHSRVSKVDYGWTEAGGAGQPAVPQTIVTFEVVRPLVGSVASGSFSLRFIGGPDGQGRFMRASHVPVFQPGDEDILFVRNGGEKGCALAGCMDGRFRLLNGQVHDGHGVPVQAIESGRVVAAGEVPAELRTVRYPRPDFDQLLKRPEVRQALQAQGLSAADARRLYEAQAPAMVEMGVIAGGPSAPDRAQADGQGQVSSERAKAPGRGLSADGFAARVAGLSLPRAEGAPAFSGLAPETRLSAPSAGAAVPARQRDAGRAPTRSAADLAEERSLPKDGPSITRQKAQ
ncbi:MAG: hypothetical protein ACOZJX_09405 [Pseudomonadota bacterium]